MMFGRNQRPTGVRVKRVSQITLFLAIIIWLLYLYSKGKEYDGSTTNKIIKEDRSLVLGRKGNAGSIDEDEVGSEYVNPTEKDENKEDGGGGDDELDRSAEEKDEEESLHKGIHDSLGYMTTHKKKENEKETDPHQQEKPSNERDGSDSQTREPDKTVGSKESFSEESKDSQESITNFEGQKDAMEPEAQGKKPQNTENETDAQVRDGNEAVDRSRNDNKDKDSKKSEEHAALQPTETEGAIVPDQNDIGINGFHDQNGVPQDGYDLLNSSATETQYEWVKNPEIFLSVKNQTELTARMNTMAEEVANLSRVNNRNDTDTSTDNMILEGEAVGSQEGNNTSGVEIERNVEGLKIGTSTDAEINSESSDSFDMSNIIRTSGETLENNSARIL